MKPQPIKTLVLDDIDIEMFARFRIGADLLRAAKVCRVDDRTARAEYGIKLDSVPGADLSGIWFPYVNPLTGHRVTGRVRRDYPEIEIDDKGQEHERDKYLSPYGDTRLLYYPPGASEMLNDIRAPVVFVEAEKSVLALTPWAQRQGRRLLAVGTGGCWGWRGQTGIEADCNGHRELQKGPLPDFDFFEWQGREAILVFDSNATTNPNVQAAREALAKELQSRGARVRIAGVPALPGLNGPDDLIAERGDEALQKVLAEAREPGVVANVLWAAGFQSLTAASTPDERGAVLRKLTKAAGGEDAVTRALVRGQAVKLLSAIGEKSPARLVDAALPETPSWENSLKKPPAADHKPWPDVVDGSALLGELVNFIRRFVVMTEGQATVWALWVAHTHALDAAEQTPYLSITSPEKRSGKTRVLEVSELVVARPWLTGRVSAAALVRKIDFERPTLLLDESDAAFNGEKDYAEALRGILNTGHRANGCASLCVGKGADLEVRDFSTFCPKAIAGIGRLPDTVADRAISIRLRRKAGAEKVARFREKAVRTEASPLLAKLEAWAAANMQNLRAAKPELPDQLSDRAQDGAEPLLAIADVAGGGWPERARQALVKLFSGVDSEDDSIGVQLLRDCRSVFEARSDEDRLASASLCGALLELEESPWRELHKRGPLTVRDLSRLLSRYGIISGTIRVGEKTAKGYYRSAFEDDWARYVPQTGFPSVTTSQANAGAGFVDFSKRHTGELVTEEKRDFVNTVLACDVVTDENPHEARETSMGAIAPTDEQGFLPGFAAAEAQPQAPAQTLEGEI